MGPVWNITNDQVCTAPELVVDRNITIMSGGSLELRGCVLKFSPQPYQNKVLAAHEGLRMKIMPGANLTMVAEGGRGAGLGRADPRYGYTVDNYGDVRSVGLPGAWNTITGLEGNFQGSLALGGFGDEGTSYFEYTHWFNNSGPGLFVVGGALQGQHLRFDGAGGLAASRPTKFLLNDLDMNITLTAMQLGRALDARISDCRIRAGSVAISLAGSRLDMQRCTVDSAGVAFDLRGSAATLHHVQSSFGAIGVGARVEAKLGGASSLVADNFTLTPLAGALRGIAGTGVALHLKDCDIGLSMVLVDSSLEVARCKLGPISPAIETTNPVSVLLDGVLAARPIVAVYRQVAVRVVSDDGHPLSNVTVDLLGHQNRTDENGLAAPRWLWLQSNSSVTLDWPKTIEIHLDSAGQSYSQNLPGNASAAKISLTPALASTAPVALMPVGAWVGVAVAVIVASAWLFWIRKR